MSYTVSRDAADVLLDIAITHKVNAIKQLRRITGAGLKESKDAIEDKFIGGGVITIAAGGGKDSIIEDYIKMQMYQAQVFEKLMELME